MTYVEFAGFSLSFSAAGRHPLKNPNRGVTPLYIVTNWWTTACRSGVTIHKSAKKKNSSHAISRENSRKSQQRILLLSSPIQDWWQYGPPSGDICSDNDVEPYCHPWSDAFISSCSKLETSIAFCSRVNMLLSSERNNNFVPLNNYFQISCVSTFLKHAEGSAPFSAWFCQYHQQSPFVHFPPWPGCGGVDFLGKF